MEWAGSTGLWRSSGLTPRHSSAEVGAELAPSSLRMTKHLDREVPRPWEPCSPIRSGVSRTKSSEGMPRHMQVQEVRFISVAGSLVQANTLSTATAGSSIQRNNKAAVGLDYAKAKVCAGHQHRNLSYVQ